MHKILLIEDNLEIRENTIEMLELEGYVVIAASDGNTGLDTAKSILPDLILCDIMMPGLNGYEVLRNLRGHEPSAAIPLIFLTANSERKDEKAGMDLGANGYIRKPYEMHVLLAEVKRCLGTL